MSALATVAGKSSNGKFTAKIDFPIGYFMLPLLLLTFRSLKSLHTLLDKCLNRMLVKFEQNRMVRTIQNFEFFEKIMANYFSQSVDAILKDVSVTETRLIAKLLIKDYHLSVFQKLRLSDTCNQHGRPKQS